MKVKTLLASTMVLTSMVGGGVLTQAAEYSDATHAKTDADITFVTDSEPTNPVDPTDPEKPVDPIDPINPNGGELMITYASNLHFGKQLKSETSWNAIADKDKGGKEYVPFVSIKDSRGTDRKSWSLTVKQDGAFTDGKAEIKGAELTYSNLFFAAVQGAPSATSGSLTLSSTAQEIATADANTGIGQWSIGLGNKLSEGNIGYEKDGSGKLVPVKGNVTNGVTLSIPKTSAKNTSKYATTVTYELIADPSK